MIRTALALFADLLRLLRLTCRSRVHLAAENLFLHKQLAYYIERKVRPTHADNATRVTLVLLSRFVAWWRLEELSREFYVFVFSLGRSLTYDRQAIGHMDAPEPEELLMADPKFDELATDIDDASTAVEELQVDHDDDSDEKLDDLHKILEHASDMIDEIGEKDEKE